MIAFGIFRIKKTLKVVPEFCVTSYDIALPLVFMHIPKTSGVALCNALADGVGPDDILTGFDGVLFGSFREFETINPALRKKIYLEPATLPRYARLVAAHMSLTTITNIYSKAQYITFVREPYSRIISHWLYWRSLTDSQLAVWGNWGQVLKRARKPFSEFLSCCDVACQIDNLLTRMLLWPHRLIPDNDFIGVRDDKALVEEAISKLEQFAYIDVIENPFFQINLEKWLGRKLSYTVANRTNPVPKKYRAPLYKELTPLALDLLEERSRLDLKLWLALARKRIPSIVSEHLRARVLVSNVARHAGLMTKGDLD